MQMPRLKIRYFFWFTISESAVQKIRIDKVLEFTYTEFSSFISLESTEYET